MIAVFLVALVIFGLIYGAWSTITTIFEPPVTNSTQSISLVIQNGENTQQIADDLYKKGLIRNPLAFRIWARIKGLDTTLEAGAYTLTPNMTIDQIIAKLQNGQPDAKPLLVVEGWRLEQIADAGSQSGLQGFDKQQFLNYVKHPDQFPDRAKYSILQQIPKGQSMEGLLYPDTYLVPVSYNTRQVIDMMLDEFTKVVKDNNLIAQAQQNGLSEYQMVILASITQREVRFTDDMKPVASVYWNRIKKPTQDTNSLLQSDPTVQYARDTDNPPAKYWQPLTDSGNNIDPNNIWNTYTHAGWPPTPIASPGLLALKAAASPAKTQYYYFLSKKDGHNVYAKTYAEFQQLENQYLSH